MSRDILAPLAPTWDVTYRGLPLRAAAYTASLRLLGEFARGEVNALRSTTLDRDEHEAWIALDRCGVIEGVSQGDGWNTYRLTAYGRTCQKQKPPALGRRSADRVSCPSGDYLRYG